MSSSQPSSPSTVHDSTEETIARMIEGFRRFLNPQHGNTTAEEEEAAIIKINPAIQKHFELKIKILQDAPRSPDKLGELLKIKQRQYEKATLAEEIQPLVTEIEMLQFVICLVNRDSNSNCS